jgi:hypothetical protein
MSIIKNWVPTQATKKTPHELFFGTKAKIAWLEELGLELWVLHQSSQMWKLDAKSHKYHFMAYGDNSSVFRYYKPDSQQILLTRNTIFVPPNTKEINYEDLKEVELPLVGGVRATTTPSTPTKSSAPKPGVFTPPAKSTKATMTVAPLQPTTPPKSKPGPSTPAAPPAPWKGHVQPWFVAPLPGIMVPSTALAQQSARTEGIGHDYVKLNCLGQSTPENDQGPEPWKDEVTPPEQVKNKDRSSEEVEDELETPASTETVDYAVLEDKWAEYAYVAITNPHDEDHPTFEETFNHWDSDQWSIARDEEIEKFQLFKTFKLTDLPPGFKLLKSWWVNVVKHNQDGEPVRYHARLVVKGFGQQFGIDYGEVFAHVLCTDTLHLLFALAAIHDWDMWSLDVVSAFLNGWVEEEIYMEQIPGYKDHTNRVLHVVGSLYGLKQAPRIWNKTFMKKVLAIGYKWTAADPSLFLWEQNSKTSILAVYVDDIAIFTTCGFAKEVVKELMKLFEMRD